MSKNVYNTFVVVNCKSRKIELVTSSARKAKSLLKVGHRIEVWNCNEKVENIHAKEKEKNPMNPYVEEERMYIAKKQALAEEKNKRRKEHACCCEKH